jgi:AcrR family transcriptional regulator
MSVKERREREEKARLEAILASAETVFARSGYYEARMEDIAREAELAKGTLYYYFKSKDEIYLHLLEREARAVHEEISRRITEDASLLEALREAFDLYLEYFEAHPAYLKLFVPCLCGTIRFEGSAMRSRAAIDAEAPGAFFADALKKKLRREKLPINPDDMMKFLKTLQIGIGLKLLDGRKDEARAAVRFFLDLIRRVMEDNT